LFVIIDLQANHLRVFPLETTTLRILVPHAVRRGGISLRSGATFSAPGLAFGLRFYRRPFSEVVLGYNEEI